MMELKSRGAKTVADERCSGTKWMSARTKRQSSVIHRLVIIAAGLNPVLMFLKATD